MNDESFAVGGPSILNKCCNLMWKKEELHITQIIFKQPYKKHPLLRQRNENKNLKNVIPCRDLLHHSP